MTIWMRLGGRSPKNRDRKWPWAVQFLVYALFGALFIAARRQASALVFGNAIFDWAMRTFGDAHFSDALSFLSILTMAEVTAWYIGVQRCVTFCGHTLRRWTILPMALGEFALNLALWLITMACPIDLPLPTEDPLVYTAAHAVLYVVIVAVFCAFIHALRRHEAKAGWLAAANVALVLFLAWCNVCSMACDRQLMMAADTSTGASQVTVTTFSIGESAEDLPQDEMLTAILERAGLDPSNVTIVPAGTEMSAPTDPFAAYEEAVAPATRLGEILQWVQLIPIFFAMRHWLFAADGPACSRTKEA